LEVVVTANLVKRSYEHVYGSESLPR
jgi:hypothetical protein